MLIAQVVLLVTGIVLLVIGYRKENRNFMLIAAIFIFIAGGLESFVEGWQEGFSAGKGTG